MFMKDDGNSSIITMIISIISFYFMYQYRYRIFNKVMGSRWFRRFAVALAMQIPFIRNRFVTRFMPF